MILDRYKTLITKIRKLPIDEYTLSKLKYNIKSKFQVATKFHRHNFNSKQYNKCNRILDDIIEFENWHNIPKVLDYIHKDIEGKRVYPEHYNMVYKFNNLSYNDLRTFPHIHLLEDLDIDPKFKKQFRIDLSNELPHHNLPSVMSPSSKELQLPQIIPYNPDSPKLYIEEVKTFHNFISKNAITHLKLGSYEVVYPPNRFGKPMHINNRDTLLQKKLTVLKSILKDFKPISHTSLIELNKVVNYEIKINRYFFKSMVKSRTMVNKPKGKKKLIPNEKNIIKIYKSYLMKQFFIDGGYKMNSLVNFYD